MEKYALGPNGALIMAADLIADEIENLTRDIEEAHADIVIVDTPGQMELFAFRASGPYIVNELTKEPKAILYLFDAVFSASTHSTTSPTCSSQQQSTTASSNHNYMCSQKLIYSPKKDVQSIASWSANPRELEDAIETKLEGTKRLFSRNMMQAIDKLGMKFLLMPVSSKTNEGMVNINTVLERILNQGEKYTT